MTMLMEVFIKMYIVEIEKYLGGRLILPFLFFIGKALISDINIIHLP